MSNYSFYYCSSCSVLPACVSELHALAMPMEAKRGGQPPWDWSYRQLPPSLQPQGCLLWSIFVAGLGENRVQRARAETREHGLRQPGLGCRNELT